MSNTKTYQLTIVFADGVSGDGITCFVDDLLVEARALDPLIFDHIEIHETNLGD